MTKIILISGASGVAKSSTAKRLSETLNITHRLGSGFIREMAKSFISENSEPSLYRYSFYKDKSISPFDNLNKQSELIQPMMQLAIDRANREGTDLILEGVNVIPGLTKIRYSNIKYLLLYIKNKNKHFEMINGDTHSKRRISHEQFELVREIQNVLLSRAAKYNWLAVDLTQEDGKNEFRRYLFQ